MSAAAVLRVRGLEVGYGRGASVLESVDLDVHAGEMVALVGESGSGKSTLGRAVLRLVEPRAGRVEILGRDVLALRPRQLRELRRSARMIMQDTTGALDPRMTVAESLVEPLRIHRAVARSDRRSKVERALEDVGLDPALARRYPHELSGGQRQRVVIARALIVQPGFVVADEAVSALDATVRAEVLSLLLRMQESRGFGCLFITHDIAVARRVADTVATLRDGRIVEHGPAEQVLDRPKHPYTAMLVETAPVPDPVVQRARRTARAAALAAAGAE